MYGIPDAAQNWQNKCFETVHDLAFVTGKESPCYSHRLGWQMRGVVHGSEFVFVGKSGK